MEVSVVGIACDAVLHFEAEERKNNTKQFKKK